MISNNAAALAKAGNIDQAIDKYTKAIDTKPGHAPYHSARGQLYDLAGHHDAALIDFDEAIALDRDNVSVWEARAHSHYQHCEYKKAVKDFNEAVSRSIDFPYNFFNRGRAAMGWKKFSIAVTDFTSALDRMPGFPGYEHAALWLHVARGRMGQDGSKDLADFWHTRVTTRGTWLIPVIRMYVGKMTPEQCLAASADEDPKIHDHQMCNAHFHVGEHYRIAGDREKAKQHFEQAVSIGAARAAECAEYAAAQAAAPCPDPVEAARLARCARLSEYYAAVAELDILAKFEELRQKRIAWGHTRSLDDETDYAQCD